MSETLSANPTLFALTNTATSSFSGFMAVISIIAISLSNISYATMKKNGPDCWLGLQMKPILTKLSYRKWKRVHSIGEIIFGFAAVGLSIVECGMYCIGRLGGYFSMVSHLDNCVALPSLALATLSGLAMTYQQYFKKGIIVPQEIEYTFRLLNLFGLFWLVADKFVQYTYRPGNGVVPPFWIRLLTSVVSGVIYFQMRGVMRQFARKKKME
ncbi:hypothetical protein ACHAXS_007538 [Conticribra weissflogii]